MVTDEQYQEALQIREAVQVTIETYEKEQLEKSREGLETHLCPRRNEGPVPAFIEDTDYWEPRGNNRCCSFCGCIHPAEFENILDKVIAGEEGYAVEPTTKGYKFYVRQPGVSNAEQGGIKFYTMHAHAYLKIDDKYIERVNEKLYKVFQS